MGIEDQIGVLLPRKIEVKPGNIAQQKRPMKKAGESVSGRRGRGR
jgi:hypothetical protein